MFRQQRLVLLLTATNPAEWIDFLAPRERPLCYGVIACDAQDSNAAASRSTEPVELTQVCAA